MINYIEKMKTEKTTKINGGIKDGKRRFME